MKLYKYLAPDVLELVLSEEGIVSLRCSYPKEYNDPYELFLTIDADEVEPEVHAFYLEILGGIPQFPTTCFSKLPNVIPMWAHYARESKGFVIEVDEEELLKSLPEGSIDDVDYKDEPNVVDLDRLRLAHATTKPRHTILLQRSTFGNAYFTKHISWSYEAERRLIVDDTDVRMIGDLMILDLPTDCITAIISGPRSEDALTKRCREISRGMSCEYYEMQIGKSSMVPYFMNTSNEPFLFNGQGIENLDFYCEECGEPLYKEDFLCNWCKISETHQSEAASRNPLRLLSRYGLLEAYMNKKDENRDEP